MRHSFAIRPAAEASSGSRGAICPTDLHPRTQLIPPPTFRITAKYSISINLTFVAVAVIGIFPHLERYKQFTVLFTYLTSPGENLRALLIIER